MNIFHRTLEVPSEAAPEEGTVREEVASWSYYDTATDETALVTLSVLVSTRITLTSSTAAAPLDAPSGAVGCEWRFLLVKGPSSTETRAEAAPTHTRFCVTGRLPPPMALRGQGGVVFLDARRVLVLVDAVGAGAQTPAPALDYFAVQTPTGTASPRWVRCSAAVPLTAGPSKATGAVPLLVTALRQSQSRAVTEVLTVVSSPAPPFELTATVLSVSPSPASTTAPPLSVQRTYTCTERAVCWPDTSSASDPAAAAMRGDSGPAPQDWEWVWVAGGMASEAPAPVHGALVAVAPSVARAAQGSSTTSRSLMRPASVVCAGVLPGGAAAARAGPLAIGVAIRRDKDGDDDGTAALLTPSDALMAAASGAREAYMVQMLPIGRAVARLPQREDHPQKAEASLSARRRAAPLLLHWVLDCAADVLPPRGPAPVPGLYTTDAHRDLAGTSSAHRVVVDSACAWDGLALVNLAHLASLLPVAGRVRLAHSLAHTSWAITATAPSCSARPPFRCFVGADPRRTQLHCLYVKRDDPTSSTPLLVYDASPEKLAALVEHLASRLLASPLPRTGAPLSSSSVEQWAWETVMATTQELWRACFQLDESAEPHETPSCVFSRCLDAQLVAHPFAAAGAPAPVHARHVVTLAHEALAQSAATPGAVDAAKARAALFVSALCHLVENVDAVACESHHEQLVRQLLLLLLGSGTQLEALRIHAVVQTASPPVCSERQAALLGLYAASRGTATSLELCVRDILSAPTHTADGEGATMMMEYALTQSLDEAAFFRTLQRLSTGPVSASAGGAASLPRGVLDAQSMRVFFTTLAQPHVADVLTPSQLCLPFFADAAVAPVEQASDEAGAATAWARWSARLPAEGTPLCLPDFLLHEEIADWSLFPWGQSTLPRTLASWRVLVDAWQRAVLAFESERADDAAAPLWVVRGRRHRSLLTRLARGVEALQRLSSVSDASAATLTECFRRASPVPALSSWSNLLEMPPADLYTPQRATPTELDAAHAHIVGRVFLSTKKPWCEAVAPWTLVVWEHYLARIRDDALSEAAACADTVLTTLAASARAAPLPDPPQWRLFLRVARGVYVALLPRLVACAEADGGEEDRSPRCAEAADAVARRPAGEWCQRLLQCLQGVDQQSPPVVASLQLLAELTALQPSVADLIRASRAEAVSPSFHLSFPCLYAVACLAGNRRALVTLAAALRPDVRRFVKACVDESPAGGGCLASAEAAKAFINEHVECLEPYVDVLSRSHGGGDPLCEPLLRLLFLESVHAAASEHAMTCLQLAVARVCASVLRPEERRLLQSALTAPFAALIPTDGTGVTAPTRDRAPDVALPYVAQPFHALVQQRLVPQIQHTVSPRSEPEAPNPLHAVVRRFTGGERVLSGDESSAARVASVRLLIQQEEAFARRRLTESLMASYHAFTTSRPFWDAVQTLYLALRCEGYRRTLLDLAMQQKDMTFTLFSAEMQRSLSSFRSEQRRLGVAAAERHRTGTEQLWREERKGRASIEEEAVDSLQRVYLAALQQHRGATGTSAPTPHQAGDYVAEAGSAILGTLNKWQKKLAGTVAPPPPPKPAAAPITHTAPLPSVHSTSVAEGWGWDSDDDDDDDDARLSSEPQPTVAAAPAPCAPVLHNTVATSAAAADNDWGWSDSEEPKADDDWDWPAESEPVRQGDATISPPVAGAAETARVGHQSDDEWEWPSSSDASAADAAFDAEAHVLRSEMDRNAFLSAVL